jgi:hypothetical protein
MSQVLSRQRIRLVRQQSNERDINFATQNTGAWWRYYYAHKQVTGEQAPLPPPKPRTSQPLPHIADEMTVRMPAITPHSNPSIPAHRPQQERHTSGNHDLSIITLSKKIEDEIDAKITEIKKVPQAVQLHPKTAWILSSLGQIREGYYHGHINVRFNIYLPIDDFRLEY